MSNKKEEKSINLQKMSEVELKSYLKEYKLKVVLGEEKNTTFIRSIKKEIARRLTLINNNI